LPLPFAVFRFAISNIFVVDIVIELLSSVIEDESRFPCAIPLVGISA